MNSSSTVAPSRGASARLPLPVLAAATFAALIHLLPLIIAGATTPAGWHFTGNVQNSADLMVYRQWFRQTQLEGPLISNVFTTEPNRPHLFVGFAYAVGAVAARLHVSPEMVYAYGGSAAAFVFVLVLHRVIAAFVVARAHQWWILGALILGGGFGGHLKLLLRFEAVRAIPGVRALIYQPLTEWLLFEDYRGLFVFTTFFDTHFLVPWTLACAAVLSLYRQIQRPSPWRLATAMSLFAFTTLMHVYTGVTIAAVAAGVAVVCGCKRVEARGACQSGGACILAAVAAMGLLGAWQRSSGLPFTPWRPKPVLPVLLFLAYPLPFVLTAWGLPRLWRNASLETCMLLGWTLGCLTLTLAAPFNPFTERGALSLQVPLTILGGLAYFAHRPRPTATAVAVAASILLATPSWAMARTFVTARFTVESPAKFINERHQHLIARVRLQATARDVLVADEPSLLWLAPDYPGRLYIGHYFLTVNYDRKRAAVERFYDENTTASQRGEFLRHAGATLVFVPARFVPARFRDVEGLTLVEENEEGALFSRATSPP